MQTTDIGQEIRVFLTERFLFGRDETLTDAPATGAQVVKELLQKPAKA